MEVAGGEGFVIVGGEEVGGWSAPAKLTGTGKAVHCLNYFKINKFYSLFVGLDVREEVKGLEEGGIVVIDKDLNVLGIGEGCS